MLIHRAAFWVSRIRNASSATADNVDNVKRAMSDIDQSFSIMKRARAIDKLDGKLNAITEACYLLCLIKSIQINLHYTQQVCISVSVCIYMCISVSVCIYVCVSVPIILLLTNLVSFC